MSPPTLEELFVEHGAFVFRVIRRLGAPAKDVEDLTQEVFLVAFRRLSDFDGRSPKAWLFRIATHVASAYRKRASTRRESLEPPKSEPAAGDNPAQRVYDGQLRTALDAALQTLTDAERAIFLLHELERLPMRECVLIADCPLQTGYSRLKAARAKMRAHLESQTDIAPSRALREVI